MQSIQEHFATVTEKAAKQLREAFDIIPADKQHWSPMEGARSAADQLAEVAILNGSTAEIMRTKAFPADFDLSQWAAYKTSVAENVPNALSMLEKNTATAVAAIKGVPDSDLEMEVAMPWGIMKVIDIVSYPYWNMSYHEGQINYIASMLGTLS